MDPNVPRKSMVKVTELASSLGMSKWKVYRQIAEGKIRAVRIGRVMRVYTGPVKPELVP
jgi:excisionase family DNA binding protein